MKFPNLMERLSSGNRCGTQCVVSNSINYYGFSSRVVSPCNLNSMLLDGFRRFYSPRTSSANSFANMCRAALSGVAITKPFFVFFRMLLPSESHRNTTSSGNDIVKRRVGDGIIFFDPSFFCGIKRIHIGAFFDDLPRKMFRAIFTDCSFQPFSTTEIGLPSTTGTNAIRAFSDISFAIDRIGGDVYESVHNPYLGEDHWHGLQKMRGQIRDYAS